MSAIDFLVIGDTQYDTVMVLEPDEVEVLCKLDEQRCVMELDYASKLPVSQLHAMVAGNAANASVTSARLGKKTVFWTLLGDDDIADRQLAHFQREHISTRWAQKVRGGQSNQSTVISVAGERTILVYHAPRQYVFPRDLPVASWVYLTSMGNGSDSITADLIAYIKRTGALLAYQPGTFQLRLGAHQSTELLAATTVVLMNKEEAQAYTGLELEQEIPALIGALHALGPTFVVVTDGTNGSFASGNGELWQMGIRPEIPRVESTGAGDAYSSAFVVALSHGLPLSQALRWAALNAEAVIQQYGPQAGILDRAAMDRELAHAESFSPTRLV